MTIAEVSKEYDIPEDTLRYYERIGLIPPVHRRKSGIRDYTEEDRWWVYFAKCMRSAGLSIEILAEYTRLYQQGDETIDARKKLLVDQRALLKSKLREMEKTLEHLSYKISLYESGKMRTGMKHAAPDNRTVRRGTGARG